MYCQKYKNFKKRFIATKTCIIYAQFEKMLSAKYITVCDNLKEVLNANKCFIKKWGIANDVL